MSEDYQHQKIKKSLNIFSKNINNFFSNSLYEKFGRILNFERAKVKILFKKIPDIMVLDKSKRLVWVGEAKTSGDFNSLGEFKTRNILQLNSYCKWLNENKLEYNSHLLVYCVPSNCVSDTRNEIKKLLYKNSTIQFKVISNRND